MDAADRLSSLFDDAGTSPQDRFLLMMIERVQALESTAASLEAACLTDSMSIEIAHNSLGDGHFDQLNRLFGGFDGGPEPAAPDWAAFAARFAEAVGQACGGGVDLCEVVVEQVPRAATPERVTAGHANFMMDAVRSIFDRTAPQMFLTARVRSKQPVAAFERALVGAFDALGAARAVGAWRPTEVSAARASCRDAAAASGDSWTWRAHAHEGQRREALDSAGRFAMFLTAYGVPIQPTP